jgi:hypothetical protein
MKMWHTIFLPVPLQVFTSLVLRFQMINWRRRVMAPQMPSDPEKTPDHEGGARLGEAITKCIDYHVAEYDLTYDQVIGILEIIKLNAYRELVQGMEEEEEDEDDEC